MHETSVTGELIINLEVWKGLTPQQQEAVKSAVTETYLRWWAKWQKQNADAIDEMRVKHGTQILRTPPEILIAFLKAWDEIAKEESAKNPFFKKSARFPARLRRQGGARQALHVPALLVRGELLLAGGEGRGEGREGGGQE
jgi:TRAP-type mannitol/chloroaromatic compound transport system substrate-binding protein